MKVVILAGGLGTRLAEETEVRPKPMVEIGGRPILWHIMKHYAQAGFTEFVIALGYKGDIIKRYFLDFCHLHGDMTLSLRTGSVSTAAPHSEDWTVHLIETGAETNTGGRVKRLQMLLGTEPFMLTYGDGVSNVDLSRLLDTHRRLGKAATITAVRPPSRFGGLVFNGDLIAEFSEKPQVGEGWINGGFMVLEATIFDYLPGDQSSLEADALETLARDNELGAYRHVGFWQCMDTLRDKRQLEAMWQNNRAPWVSWTT